MTNQKAIKNFESSLVRASTDSMEMFKKCLVRFTPNILTEHSFNHGPMRYMAMWLLNQLSAFINLFNIKRNVLPSLYITLKGMHSFDYSKGMHSHFFVQYQRECTLITLSILKGEHSSLVILFLIFIIIFVIIVYLYRSPTGTVSCLLLSSARL